MPRDMRKTERLHRSGTDKMHWLPAQARRRCPTRPSAAHSSGRPLVQLPDMAIHAPLISATADSRLAKGGTITLAGRFGFALDGLEAR